MRNVYNAAINVQKESRDDEPMARSSGRRGVRRSLAQSRRSPRRLRQPGNRPKPAAKAWTAPKTPWGDPDIQGVWTSDSVRGIPTQRPAELAGKAELSDEELQGKVERDEQTRNDRGEAEGAFRNDGAWLQEIVQPDLADHRAGRRTLPAVDAGRAEARGAARSRQLRRRPVREDRRTSRCTTAASRAASSARSCRSSTATAIASCRRRGRS